MTSPMAPSSVVDSGIGIIFKVMMTTGCMGARVPSLPVTIPNHKILKQTKKNGMLPRLFIRFGGRAIKFREGFFKCWLGGGRSHV